jgi:hypothetical protein
MPKEIIEINENKGMNVQSTSIALPIACINIRIDIKDAFIPEIMTADVGGGAGASIGITLPHSNKYVPKKK